MRFDLIQFNPSRVLKCSSLSLRSLHSQNLLHPSQGKLAATLVLVWTLCFSLTHPARSASPTLEHLYPAGSSLGSTQSIAVTGKIDPWPPQVWVSGSGIQAQPETNKNRIRITVMPDADPGPHFVRLFNDEGASETAMFVVGNGRETVEVETNNRPAQAMLLSNLPITVNGRLDKNGDVDCFGVKLSEGEWITAQLDAYVLMSKMDGLLRLTTPQGIQLAWNHDSSTLDPLLQFRAPSNGTYVVQVMGFSYPADSDVRLSGGDAFVYRLHLKTQAVPPALDPSGQRETEPNQDPKTAPKLDLPGRVWGVIGEAGDEDAVRWLAKKDAIYMIEVSAASMGSPLDAWLKILGADGKELVKVDDSEGSRDPKLEWKAPADGEYAVVVGSLIRRGSADYKYRLTLKQGEPGYEATLPVSNMVLKAGETNELKVTVQRLRSLTNALTVKVDGLPAGVNAEESAVSEKGGELVLKMRADTNAAAFSGPIRFLVRDGVTGAKRPAALMLTTRSENNGVPGGYHTLLLDRVEDVWLTVKGRKP